MSSYAVAKYIDFFPAFYTDKCGLVIAKFFENFFGSMGLTKPVIIYSVFGNTAKMLPKNKDKDHVHVVWSGEPFIKDECECYDLHLVMRETGEREDTRFVFVPFMIIQAAFYDCKYIQQLQQQRKLEAIPLNFACQVTSNNNHDSHVRNTFFKRLQDRVTREHGDRLIHSMGRNNNNVGFLAPENDPETGKGIYFSLLSQFKFMLCFENSSDPYYLTEKIMNAWLGGTVPVYWGCSKALEWLNPKSFLYLKTTPGNVFPTEKDMDDLIGEILTIDADPELYRAYYEQPLLLGDIPDELNIDSIYAKCKDMLKNARPDAFDVSDES